MGHPDLFVSTDEEIDVDSEAEAAIDRGLCDADEGRGLSAEEVRGLLSQWIANLSTQTQR